MTPVRWIPVVALCFLTNAAPAARAQASRADATGSLPTWTIFTAMNLATVEGPTDANKEPLAGMVFGAALDWRLNDTFMFQPELQYAQKGYQYGLVTPIRLRLTYVEAPMLLRASTDMLDNGMRLYALFGPSLAMLRSCAASVGTANGKCNVLSQNMSTMDFGLVAGFGLDFKIRSSTWTTSLRYNWGLEDMDKSSAEARTRSFNLMLGWRI
jgi:hypothetical protein